MSRNMLRCLLVNIVLCACLGLVVGRRSSGKCPDAPLTFANVAHAEEDEEEPAAGGEETPPKTTEPATPQSHVVKKGAFRPELLLSGSLQPLQVHEVKLSLKEYQGALTVREICPSGKPVKQGDVLLVICPADMEKALRDADLRLVNARTDLEQLKKQRVNEESSSQQELEKAKQRATSAEEDLKNYQNIEWPISKEQGELGLRRSEAYLADEQTELDQLEQMYKESELAGKTKEIVLERARRNIELSKQQLSLSRRDLEFDHTKGHPRHLGDLEREVKWSARDLAQLESSKAMELEDSKQSLAGQELELVKAEESIANLRKDKQALTVKAAAPGIVVHGDLLARLAGGQPAALAPHECYKVGHNLQEDVVVMTCYEDGKYCVRLAVPESDWLLTKPDMRVQVRFSAIPGKTFAGRMAEIAALPDCSEGAKKAFSARIELEQGSDFFRPGLTCTAEFIVAEVPDAIVIPAGMLIEKEGRTFCKVAVDDGHEEREIFVAGRRGDQVWVVAGLSEGDAVLLKE